MVCHVLSRKMPWVKWVFPTAPTAPVSMWGDETTSWFDIFSLSPNQTGFREDRPGMLASSKRINALVDEEIAQVADVTPDRIVVGGFSQGGAISALTGVTSTRRLAGIASLSGFLPLKNEIVSAIEAQKEVKQEEGGEESTEVTEGKEFVELAKLVLGQKSLNQARDVPFFWGHGTADQVVKYDWGLQSARFINNQLGIKTCFNSYPGLGHQPDVDDFYAWLLKVIPEDPTKAITAATAEEGNVKLTK